MPHKGQVLTGVERLKISTRTREAMQRADVRQHLKDSFTSERREWISTFHKRDAMRPERITQSIANLPPPKRGYENPNWKGGLREKNCLYCGIKFEITPALFDTAKYCSNLCRSKAEGEKNRGQRNPNWRGGHYKNCEYCGVQFWVKPSDEKKRHYCSRSCKAKGLGTFKRLNNDPEFQQKRLKAALKKPNRQEQRLDRLLNKWFLGEWKFVGNGDVILGKLNPDFINCDGKKQIIELFGCWWHGCPEHRLGRKVSWQDSEIGRKVIYSRYGFKTLIIWEHELEDEQAVVEKITRFNRALTK